MTTSAPSKLCALCSSNEVSWRARRPTDVLFTWLRYGLEFFFAAAGKGAKPRGQYHLPRGVWMPHQEDRGAAAENFEFDGSTRRALATPRSYWRCRHCGKKGEVYDDSVVPVE
jgi:hypothetical protein